MLLDGVSQLVLMDALEELKRGSGRKFEDRLWLGFGDEWTKIRTLLLRDGAIKEVPGDGPMYALLTRGEALRQRLSEALAPKSSASMTAIDVALTDGK